MAEKMDRAKLPPLVLDGELGALGEGPFLDPGTGLLPGPPSSVSVKRRINALFLKREDFVKV